MTEQQAKVKTSKRTSKGTVGTHVKQQTFSEQLEQNSTALFLTNRYNLLAIFSSGWIKPTTKYRKYYEDLGKICPEGIPLLLQDPSASLVEDTSGHEPGSFPVLLEIDLYGISGPVQVIHEDYRTEQSELPPGNNAIALLAAGVLPASYIRTVHFRSESELQEYTTYKYGDIRDTSIPLQVSPDRFHGSPIDVAHLMEAFTIAQGAITPLPPLLFASASALGGAVFALGGLIAVDPLAAISTLVPILENLRTPASLSSTLAILQHITGPDRWLALLPSILLEEYELLVPTGVQGALLIPGIENDLSGEDLATFFLFVSIVKTLLHTSLEDKEDVLVRICEDFERQLAASSLDHSDDLLQSYRDTLATIEKVLRNRIDLANFPVARFPLATALLLFLMRDDLARTFSWISERRRPTPDTLALAIAFSGLLCGRAGFPVEYCPTPALERYIDDVMAHKLSTAVHGIVAPLPSGIVNLEVEDTPDIHRELLKEGNHVLFQRETRLVKKDNMTQSLPCEQHNAILQRLVTSDLRNSPERNAALYLCRIVGWEDCVSTSIFLKGKQYILDSRRPELRISGFLSQQPEVNIALDKFRRRLTPEVWGNLPEQIHLDMEKRLNGG